MGEVVKRIGNNEYLYFQHRIKMDNQTKVITTQIGKSNLKEEELNIRRKEAFKTHYRKLWDIEYENNRKIKYKFEIVSKEYETFLIELKTLYKLIKKFIPEEEFKLIDKKRFYNHVYGTTHIEGNAIAYNDVVKILDQEKTPSNYRINDINEVYNYLLFKSFTSHKKGNIIDEKLIKKIHSLLLNGIIKTSISGERKQIPLGKYRKGEARLIGIPFIVSPPELIEQRIEYILNEYHEKIRNKIHPFEAATIFHQEFEEIHPFTDGNGRTGREILNFMLEINEYPPVYLNERAEKRYFDALEKGNSKDHIPLLEFVADMMFLTVFYYYDEPSLGEYIEENLKSILFTSIKLRTGVEVNKFKL